MPQPSLIHFSIMYESRGEGVVLAGGTDTLKCMKPRGDTVEFQLTYEYPKIDTRT